MARIPIAKAFAGLYLSNDKTITSSFMACPFSFIRR